MVMVLDVVCRHAERRDEAVAKATVRWANVRKFKDDFARASERRVDTERTAPTPRTTIFSAVKVDRTPFGVSVQQLRHLTGEQKRTSAPNLNAAGVPKDDKSNKRPPAAVTKEEEEQPGDDKIATAAGPPELIVEEGLGQTTTPTLASSSAPRSDDDSQERLQQLQKLVGNVPLLQQLDVSQIEALSKELTYQEFAAGEEIVRQGEEGDEMYLFRRTSVSTAFFM